MSNKELNFKLGKNEILAVDAIKKGIKLSDKEKERLYFGMLDEKSKFKWEQLQDEIYKIVTNTQNTLAVSLMGNVAVMIYDIINKEFRWRFSRGIYDDSTGSVTSGYYVIKYPGTQKVEEVGHVILRTFVGEWYDCLCPLDEYDKLFNTTIHYVHVDYRYKYICPTCDLKDAFTINENNEQMKLRFRCTHLNSIRTDNRLVNLMWLTRSEERILHTINGNVYFGDMDMEVVIYRIENNIKIPIAIKPTVRSAGKFLNLDGHGAAVVEDCKGRVQPGNEIRIGNDVYSCDYYINLDKNEQMRVNRILEINKYVPNRLFDISSVEIKEILKKEKVNHKIAEHKKEFDNFVKVVGDSWFRRTSIKPEFCFKSIIIED